MAKVYAMGKWDWDFGKLSETATWAAIDELTTNPNTVTGYGTEYLTDANQATLCTVYHGYGNTPVQIARLTPTITRNTGTFSSTTSLMQSVALINVFSDIQAETDDLDCYIHFTGAGGSAVANYPLTNYVRPDGHVDMLWSGDIPAGATDAYLKFELAMLSSTSKVSIGQALASFYNQAYEIPCSAELHLGVQEDQVLSDRNTETIQTVSGQNYDKLLYARIVWSGNMLSRRDIEQGETLTRNALYWQELGGVLILDGPWQTLATLQAIPGRTTYGKWRIGAFSQVGAVSNVLSAPFTFTENPA